MVAVVVGSRLGLEQTSAWVLGARGQLGSAALGRAGENVFVNAATGNLILNNRDEFLIGQGGDVDISRTYNSLGALTDDNGDNWRLGVQRRLSGFPASPNTAGSTIVRVGEDGAEVTYTYDAAQNAYVTKEGSGAYDRIDYVGHWIWTDGDTGAEETYDTGGTLINVIDRDGNVTAYTYHMHTTGWRLSRVTTADGGYTEFSYSGNNLTQVATTYWDPVSNSNKSLTRVRYGYDGSSRLTTVTVDLSPGDNSVADGRTYVTTYTYDGTSKRVASISQTDGSRIDIAYETSGAFRVTSISQAVAAGVARTTSFNYYSTTRTDVTDADGQTTRLEYDYLGQLVKIAEPAATAAEPYQLREFTYTADGDLFRIKTGPDSWTDFFYPPGGSAGVWTSRYERTNAGYITTQRTYNAANSVLTETRYETLDPDDGGAAYQPSGAMTTRYAYDSENHLRFVVSATGAVTRYDYATNGNLIRSTAFAGARYNVAGLAIGDSIAEATLDSWAANLADKTAAQITETVYDFRGNIAQTIAYSTVLATGGADAGAPATRTDYVYDQAGKLLSRHVTGLSNAETFIYDGLGRTVSAVDFNGSATTTAFHDALGTTVIRMADGLNKVSVYNKAGEVVSYSESERGANLVNLQGWPEYDPNLPGYATQPTWPTWYNWETRWQTTMGLDGQPVAAMQAGQLNTDQSGGGSHTNSVAVDASKTYEFVYYFKKSDLTAHSIYFGLSGGSPAYVELATGSGADPNPYFYAAAPAAQQSLFQQDKWYKVVGYVLPQGSANILNGQMGGVYDVETGQKVANVDNYRWSASRPDNVVNSRYFDYYSETEPGFSTYFYKPEMRRTDQPSVNLINLSGWPGPAEPPAGTAAMPGWLNNYQVEETRWQYIDGPDGRQVTAIHAGQYDAWNSGGGQYSNQFTINGSKDYEFVYYFRKNDLDSHIVFFGLSGGDPAYVKNSTDGSVETNPYFVYFNSNGNSYNTTTYQPIQEDRWYKVVGHVYAQGSTNADSSASGVFDAETGQKMADVRNFRWNAGRTGNEVHSRFFTYYEETELGFSTYFYKPEVHSFDQPSVNLIDLSSWAPPPPNSGPAALDGWYNGSNEDTRWHVVDGPEGRKVVAIQAGQFDAYENGGGNYTNEAPFDGSKAYEFTLYMRKEDLTKHNLYFGLTSNWETPPRPHVDNAIYGGGDQNPYFYASNPSMQQATLVEDRWYKVVGYVLPEGSANIAAGSLGGVFDTTTGAKVADVVNYRWRADRPNNEVHARFFDYYDQTKLGWSTSFYKPEIREVSTSALEPLLAAEATRYRYDKMGRLRMATDPTGRSTHYLFDNVGHKVGEVDADGSLTEYKYDLADRLVAMVRYATRLTAADIASLTDGMGNPAPTEVLWIRPAASADDAWSWNVHDGAGRLLQTIDGAGGSTAYEYDGASRLVKTTARYKAFTAGQIAAFKLSSPTTVQSPGDEPLGDRITRYFFDADGRQIGTLDAQGGLSRIVYDAAGRVVQTSAFANATSQALRAAGTFQDLYDSVPKDSAADVHNWSVHDGRGFLKGSVNGEGEVTLYDYTPVGHVSQVQTGRKLASILSSQPTLAQLVAAPASPVLETTTYVRNQLGQVLTETRALASGSEIVTYTYDSLHRLTGQGVNRVTGPDYGTRQRHDRRGRLIGQLSGEGTAALAALGGSPTKAQIDAVYRKWGTTFAWDAADRLISRTDPDGVDGPGFTTFYFYDADGGLAYEVNGLGEVQGHVHDGQNRRTQTIAYGVRIATAGLKGGEIVSGLPSRTSITGADSRTTLYYDVLDRVQYSEDALGRVTSYSYDAVGDLRGVHTPVGANGGSQTRTIAYDYDLLGRLKRTSDGLAFTFETLFRDAFGRVTQQVDARGLSRATSYDRAGRTIVSRDAFNNQTAYAYDARGQVITVTDRLGKVTSLTRDAFGRQVTMTTAEGLVTTTTFDDQGHTLSVTDGAGRSTSYAYDLDGQLTTVANGLGQQDVNTYDPAGRLYETTDASGVKVRYGYDGAGRVLTETVDPTGLNLTTTWVYDARGQQVRITDPSGVRTDYVFDAAGQTAEVIVDPAGLALRTVFTRDRAGNVTNLREAAGTAAERDTAYVYDTLGRVVSQQTGDASLNIRSAYVYDANGNVIRRSDGVAAGVDAVTRFTYDAENRLAFTIDGAGSVSRNEYDAEGRVIRATRFAVILDAATRAAIDGASNPSAYVLGWVSSGEQKATSYVYDNDGRLTYTVEADGRLTRLTRDGAGNVTGQTVYGKLWLAYDPSYGLAWPYTVAGLNGVTNLAVFKNDAANRTTSLVYDAANRARYSIDAQGQVTTSVYDGAGKLIRQTRFAQVLSGGTVSLAAMDAWAAANAHAQDRVTRTAYDTAGRAAFAVDAEGYVSRTVYDGAGNVASQSRFAPVVSVSDGVSAATVAALVAAHESTAATAAYSYDAAGRMTYSVDAVGSQSRFDLDGLGRTTWIWEAIGTVDQAGTAFAYDDGGRLITEIRAYGEAEQQVRSRTYDGMGRMLNEVHADGHATLRTYNLMGRVLTVTVPISSGQTAITTNTWDAFGNLVKVVDPRGNAGFFYYDSLDRLVLQVDPEGYATQTTYGVGGEAATVTRRAAKVTGSPTIYTPPTVVTGSGDATTTIVRDKLDRVVATTDAQGYAESWELNAFGDRIRVTNKLGGQTVYTYDKRGLMLSELLPITSLQTGGVPANVVNQFQYDARGNLTTMIEAAALGEARTTNYVYDKLDRLIQKSGDAVTVTSSVDFSTTTVTPTEHIVYDRRGNVIETRDAAGARTLFWYDDNDRKVAEVDAVGALKTWAYDLNNNATVARVYDTPVALPGAPGGTAPAEAGAYRETINTYDRNNRLTQSKVANLWVGEATGSTYVTTYTDLLSNIAYDAAGNVIRTDHGDGSIASAFYDALGRQIATVDAEGYLTTYARDAEGNVTREVRYGIRVSGALDTGANPLPPAAPRAADASLGDRITDFTYDRNGRRLTEVRRGVAVYSAGALDRLTVADSWITYAYDGLGNVVTKTEANGDYVEYAHDLMGRQIAATRSAFVDFQGASVRRRTATTWNGWSGVTKIEDGEQSAPAAQNRVTFFSYSTGGRLDATTDATGFVRYFGYDAAGRVTRESYDRLRGDGVTVTEGRRYGYDLLGRLTSESAASSNGTWSFGDTRTTAYTTHGEVTAKGVNGLWQERFEYDKAGRLYRSTAGDGVTRVYLYDRAGRATMTVASTGADITNWTGDNVVQAFTNYDTVAIGTHDVPGVAATFTTYDKRGLATGTREPFRQLSRDITTGAYTTATIVRDRAYNAFGEVTSETDARGFVTDFTYNTMGRIIETRRPTVAFTNEQGVVSSARPTEQSRFDVSGRLVATRTANGYWTSRTLAAGSGHNGEEAIAVGQLNPDGGSITYGVDVFGDIRKVTDQLGAITLNTYDKAGQLISVQHPGRAAYSAGNNTGSLVQLTDYYAYDGLGQRINHWNSQFGTSFKEKTVYDREGRVVSQIDFENHATTYSYVWDATLSTAGMGAFGGSAIFGGWIRTTTHASGKVGIERLDSFGRLTGKTDLGGRTYAMGFDQAGRLVSQTSSVGQSLTWSWYNTGLMARQTDLTAGGTQADYAYDAAGLRLRERYATGSVVRQDGYATYDALGRMTEFKDVSDNATDPTRTLWTFDLNGNVRSTQTNYRKVDAAPSSATSATSTFWNRYDAMDRMVHVEGSLSDGEIRLGRRLEYDAVGNRVRMLTETSIQTDNITGYGEVWVPDPDPGGGGGMEEIPEDPGGGGHWESYPIYETRPGFIVENYDYTADGYLARVGQSQDEWNTSTNTVVRSAVTWRSQDIRDAMGRLTYHSENSGVRAEVAMTHSRTASYDKAGLLLSEQTFTYVHDNPYAGVTAYFRNETTTYSYFEASAWRGVVTAVTTSAYRDPWPLGTGSNSNTPLPSTSTNYAYTWWDDARQASLTYDGDTGSTSVAPQTSTFTYDKNGRISSVYIGDARPRTVTFVTDAQGQVLTRTEADNNPNLADPRDRYWYFGGQRIGEVTNNSEWSTTYVNEMRSRAQTPVNTTGPFIGNSNYARYGVDFDLAYEALTPGSVRSTGTAWTVRDGDTLQGIAAAVWGDASLWYMIAEANGLTSASLLSAGQTLTVPARAGNVHNTSETFRPYDPNEALGNVSPTQPKPPKKAGGCGMIGQMIMVVIAVAVAALVLGPAAAGITNFFAAPGAATAVAATASTWSLGGAIAGGAIAGAAGSIASQAFGVVTGIQDKFDWKGVALSALSSAVSAGLGSVMKVAEKASKLAQFTNAVQRGALGSVITQGVAVATGLQDSFSWTSVAVSAVSAGVGQAVGAHLPAHYTAEQAGFVSSLAGGTAGAAAKSMIDGTSFGDNLVATLPSVIGNTIGNMIAGRVQMAAQERDEQARMEREVARLSRGPTGEYYRSIGADFKITPGGITLQNSAEVMDRILADEKLGLIRSALDVFDKIPIDAKTDFVNTYPHSGLADTADYGGVIFSYNATDTARVASSRWVTVGNDYATRFLTGQDGATYVYTDGTQRIGALNLELSFGQRENVLADVVVTGTRPWTPMRGLNTVLDYTGLTAMGVLNGAIVQPLLGTATFIGDAIGTGADAFQGVNPFVSDSTRAQAHHNLGLRWQTAEDNFDGLMTTGNRFLTDEDFRRGAGDALAQRYSNGPEGMFNLSSDLSGIGSAFIPGAQAGKVGQARTALGAVDDLGELARIGGATDNASEYITLFRGDRPGTTIIKSNAAWEGGYASSGRIIDSNNLDDLFLSHALDSSSPPSPFISLTTDPDVARFFAGADGIVNEFRIPLSRASPNPFNKFVVPAGPGGRLVPEAEYLVPNYIRPSELVRKP